MEMEVTARRSDPVAPGLPVRELVWRVLQAVAAGAYADAALERELGRHVLPPADRALATELAYGAIRQRRLLDAWIDAHGRVPAARQPPKLRWLLHVGLYQLLFSQRVPAAAAVSTSVELAKRGGLARLAPVVNGLLRSVLRCREQAGSGCVAGSVATPPWEGLALPVDPAGSLALRHSLPDWLAADLLLWLEPEGAEAFARACNAPPPIDLRVNPLRTSREALLAAFASAGVAATPIPATPLGLTLVERPGDPRGLPGFAAGQWCVQDRSAQRIVPLLEARPGEMVLDACAAPGGKSTQLAEAMEDRGTIWAVDRSRARLQRVEANAERLGLKAVSTLEADATLLARERPEWLGRFARILVDAPCSGLGTLSRHADARWRITPGSIADLAELQARLLDNLAPLLAPGGRLVYATCTVHPQENGERIAAFLARWPGWRLVFEHQWWPGDPLVGDGGDGFFAAVIEAPGEPSG